MKAEPVNDMSSGKHEVLLAKKAARPRRGCCLLTLAEIQRTARSPRIGRQRGTTSVHGREGETRPSIAPQASHRQPARRLEGLGVTKKHESNQGRQLPAASFELRTSSSSFSNGDVTGAANSRLEIEARSSRRGAVRSRRPKIKLAAQGSKSEASRNSSQGETD